MTLAVAMLLAPRRQPFLLKSAQGTGRRGGEDAIQAQGAHRTEKDPGNRNDAYGEVPASE